ncbi:hypothetical protein GGR55DRAFT_182153 [Xylaria sp. FL0064]|nr:hypothetical protein GGR55DRAFT_182153 [Xylaria sp. FL0064]
MDSPESWSSSRASWMFTDPYTYQYSAVEAENNTSSISPGEQSVVTDSTTPVLQDPTLPLVRYELAADPLVIRAHDNYQTPDGPPKGPCELSRNAHSITRTSSRYPGRRSSSRATNALTAPAQPSSSGLIPVIEDPYTPAQSYSPAITALPSPRAKPSPPAYADGLMPVDENATTPKEPSSDFDAILRNIGPISKKGKGKTRRERSSRYYDRYTSNFG